MLKFATLALLALSWLGALAGFVFLASYDGRAGTSGDAPTQWPSASKVERALDKCTAVIFLHPKCPCSVATAEELAKIRENCKGKLKIIAVMWQPAANVDSHFYNKTKSPVQASIDDIPDIIQVMDPGGTEGKRFGAETSGDLALYGASGRLLFKGGITYARGHTGENAGSNEIIAAVNNEQPVKLYRTPVFGCSLQECTK